MADENTKRTYRVKPGFTHGKDKQYKAGDTVDLTDAEAKPLLDKLELATTRHKKDDTELANAIAAATDEELAAALGVDAKALTALRKGTQTTSKLVVTQEGVAASDNVARTSSDAAGKVEQQLEAETGKEFVKTGAQPPTLAETDKPAKGAKVDDKGNPPGQVKG